MINRRQCQLIILGALLISPFQGCSKLNANDGSAAGSARSLDSSSSSTQPVVAAQAANASSVFVVDGPSGGDDTIQLQQKINLAIAHGNSAVYVKDGVYNLKSINTIPGVGLQGHLVFNGGKSVSLVGIGLGRVVLKFWNSQKSGLVVHQTRNFNMQNIILDYQNPPYGQGTVQSVDTVTKTVWVNNDAGYPTWETDQFRIAASTLFLTRTTRGNTPASCDLIPQSTGSTGSMSGLNWFRYQDLSGCPDGIAAGQKVVLNVSVWSAYAIHLSQTAGAVFQNNQVYRSPGVTVLVDHTTMGDPPYFEQVLFDHFQILYSPDPAESSRQITTNADGIHIIGSRSPVNITNSLFYGMLDDAINAHARVAYVSSVYMSGTTAIMRYIPNGGFANFALGDWVEVYNPSRKLATCAANVASLPYTFPSDPGAYYVNLSSAANGCTVKEGYNGLNASTADWVADFNEAGGSGVLTISGNSFYANRGRAIVNRWWNSVITNNVIGSPLYGGPNWKKGIVEGYCPGDLNYGEGPLVYPGRDKQQVSGNGGLYGNTISGCF